MSEKRLRRVESLLQEEISYMISRREIKDPRIDPLHGVTRLGERKLFGEDEVREKSVSALNHAAGFIQKSLGKSLHLRSIPKLTFFADTSIEQGFRMTQKIKDLLD